MIKLAHDATCCRAGYFLAIWATVRVRCVHIVCMN